MNIMETYNECIAIERQLQDNNIYAFYNKLLEKLEQLNFELHEVITLTIHTEQLYKEELYQNIQALIGSWLKKTPAEAEAKESMRDKEYKVKQLQNDIDFIKWYINLAKYTLKKSLLEFNKWLTEDDNL